MDFDLQPPNLYNLDQQYNQQNQTKQNILNIDNMFNDMEMCLSEPMTPQNNSAQQTSSQQLFDFNFPIDEMQESIVLQQNENDDEQQQQEQQKQKQKFEVKQDLLPYELSEIMELSVYVSSQQQEDEQNNQQIQDKQEQNQQQQLYELPDLQMPQIPNLYNNVNYPKQQQISRTDLYSNNQENNTFTSLNNINNNLYAKQQFDNNSSNKKNGDSLKTASTTIKSLDSSLNILKEEKMELNKSYNFCGKRLKRALSLSLSPKNNTSNNNQQIKNKNQETNVNYALKFDCIDLKDFEQKLVLQQ